MASTHPLTYYFLQLLKRRGINITHVDAIELTDQGIVFSEKGVKNVIQISPLPAPIAVLETEFKSTKRRNKKRKFKPFEDLDDGTGA